VSSNGRGFRVDPDALSRAADQLHAHADEVEAHGRTLAAKTGGRVGHGPVGQVAEDLVKRGIRGVSEGVSKAVADFHRGTAKGLKAAATRTKEADARGAQSFKDLERSRRHDIPRPSGAPTRIQAPPERGPGSRFADPVEGGRLPAFNDKRTVGRLHVDGAKPLDLQSGMKGPSMAIRGKGVTGFNGNQLLHVEGHAAAHMRANHIQQADLEINRVPCEKGSGGGCNGLLPRMLPEGARVRVYGPEGFFHEYIGLPDK
jgi:hypothetical protein